MGILSDFRRALSRTKNGQKSCFARCLPRENFWKLTGVYVTNIWQICINTFFTLLAVRFQWYFIYTVLYFFHFLCSSDFHHVFEMCLNRGFAKLMDYTAENYKHFQRTENPTSK